MNKLEPNMYVRTLFGIKKIDHIDNKKTVWKYLYKINDDNEFYALSDNDVIKASHNIIDLIEVGDLIEHEKIGIKQIKDKDKYNQYIWYSKNHNPSTCDIEDAITFEAFKSEFEVGNISIVTKEQFSSMEFRLGE